MLSLSNLRFPGQYFDGETALNQNWNRDYDPTVGRYVQSDPIVSARTGDSYSYIAGNPISRIDPLGLEWQATVGISGLIGGNPFIPVPGPFVGGGVSVGFTSSGQFIVQTSATGEVGSGVFGGIGIQVQISRTKCRTPSGISVGRSLEADANFGAGPSVGASAQYDANGGGGLATGVGKVGVGYGIQLSVGVTQTTTFATPPLFSSPCDCK